MSADDPSTCQQGRGNRVGLTNDECSVQADLFKRLFGTVGYGYNNLLGDLREEFPQLQDVVYLDHAATTLYSRSQLQAAMNELNHQVFGNPHSQLGLMDSTPQCVEQLRWLTLEMCNASPEEYEVGHGP